MDKRIDINELNHVLDIRLQILYALKRVFFTRFIFPISQDRINLEYLNGIPQGIDLIHRLVYVYTDNDDYRVCVQDYYPLNVQTDPTLDTIYDSEILSQLVEYLNLSSLHVGHVVLDSTYSAIKNAVNEDIWMHYRDMVFLGHRDNHNGLYPYSGLKPLYSTSLDDYLEFTDITYKTHTVD